MRKSLQDIRKRIADTLTQAQPGSYQPDRVIVKFKTAQTADRANLEPEFEVKPIRTLTPRLAVYEVKDVKRDIARLMTSSLVEYAEPDYLINLDPLTLGTKLPKQKTSRADSSATGIVTQVDPSYGYYFDYLWNLLNTGHPGIDINILPAWEITRGNPEIVVAVIDTGCLLNHVEYKENIWINTEEIPGNGLDDDGNGYIDDINGWDFYDDDNNLDDGHGHGTQMLGTLGAAANFQAIVGVAPKIRMMPLKVSSNAGAFGASAIISAIIYAKNNHADVLNLSFGGYDPIQSLEETLADSGLLAVAGAGNNGVNIDERPFYPAAYELDNIISVAAISSSGDIWDLSNYGANSVDIAAPGVEILTSDNDGGYIFGSGTSIATPHVAAIAALMKSLDPGLSNQQIKNIILGNITPLTGLQGKMRVAGIPDAFKILSAVVNLKKLNDITTFENGHLNGWVWGPNGAPFTVKDVEGQWLMHGDEKAVTIQGSILTKNIQELQPGKQYIVAFHVKKNHDRPETPTPGMAVNNEIVIPHQRITTQDWTLLSGTFTALGSTAEVEFSSRVLFDEDSILTSRSNMDIDNIRIGEPYYDKTTFSNKNWNHWTQGSATHDQATLVERGGKFCINFPSTAGSDSGVILEKTVRDLYPLAQYRFSLCVRKLQANDQPLVISLHANGAAISAPSHITESKWISLSGTFIADNSVQVLTVENHSPSGVGNDFHIRELQIEEIV